MTTNTTASAQSNRMTVIDALRGFALLGVILMHMMDHFGYANAAGASSPTIWDSLVTQLSEKIIRGKFLSIFSFLFGLSFFIQMDRAAKKGIDFRMRFLWRMLLLFAIGLLGMSFTYVDILTMYAAFGVILVFLYPLKNWVLLLIAFLLLIGLPNLLIVGFESTETAPHASPAVAVAAASNENTQTETSAMFLQTAKQNLTIKAAEKLKYQFITSNTGYMVLALFILGFITGRIRFFEQVHIRKKRNWKLLAIFFVSAVVLYVLLKYINRGGEIRLWEAKMKGGEATIIAFIGAALKNLNSIAISGLLATGFIVLYHVNGIGRFLNLLTPYGRMGLTNYELQNIFGAIIFSYWGFGAYFGTKGATVLFSLGILYYVFQALTSYLWLRKFLYGPFEWLWRSGTYLKIQSLRKKKTIHRNETT